MGQNIQIFGSDELSKTIYSTELIFFKSPGDANWLDSYSPIPVSHGTWNWNCGWTGGIGCLLQASLISSPGISDISSAGNTGDP